MSVFFATAAAVAAVSAGALAVWCIVRLVNRGVSVAVMVFAQCSFAALICAVFFTAAFERAEEDESRQEFYAESAELFDLPDSEIRDGQ